MAKQAGDELKINLPSHQPRPSLSPIHSIYHHQLRIDKPLELVARFFQGAACFVQSILSHNKCEITAICPYQFDFCIAVGKPLEVEAGSCEDDSDDEDEFMCYDIEDEIPIYTDYIGDIEDKLIKSGLRYESKDLNPHLESYDLTAREFINLLKALKTKYARSNPFEVNGNYVYPHKKRFVVMVDVRNINDQRVYIYEAPEKYRDIPNQNTSKWCVNATNECLLPGYDGKEDIGASSPCHGSLLTLSFHVFQEDEIKCHLGWNGKLCSVEPSDLKEALPRIFNMEHTMTGIINREFMRKIGDDASTDYRFWWFTLDEMTEDISNIINGRGSYMDLTDIPSQGKCIAPAGDDPTDSDDNLDGDMLDELEYIVQLQDTLARPDPDFMHHLEIVSDDSVDLPDLNDDQYLNNHITQCPQRGSVRSHGQSGNYNGGNSNPSGNQSHYANNGDSNNFNARDGNNKGSGGNENNGGGGDDEKYNDHTNNMLIPPCPGCRKLLKSLMEKDMQLKQKEMLIQQKDAMIMQLQTQLVNQIRSQGVPYPMSMPQQFNNNYNWNDHYSTNGYDYRNSNTFNRDNMQISRDKHKPSPPPLYTPTDIQSRSISIPSAPNSPQPEYLSRSTSMTSVTSTSTLASVSTESYISSSTTTESKLEAFDTKHRYTYKPPSSLNPIRLSRNVYVPRGLTQCVISKMKTKFKDCKELYSWMDINTMSQFDRKENNLNESARILNFGFVDKDTKEHLYCIAEKKEQDEGNHNHVDKRKHHWAYKWRMVDTLYTKQMVINEFQIKVLPDTSNITADTRIRDYLRNSKNWNKMINKTRWCKLRTFSSEINNKRLNAFTIIPEEFKKDIKASVDKTQLELIPILMFIDNHYEIHHVLIADINGSNIAISFIYDEKLSKVQVKGIHTDKSLLCRQHQWASSLQHVNKCKCFDNFDSHIDHLVIGTTKDKENQTRNLKNMVNKLTKQNKILQIQLNSYRDESTSPSEISYHSSRNSSSYSLKDENI